ncbi:MAG: rhodanese-like domain-containing protein [Bacteroidales bacterium]|nr:rhodanese-like domain-containing protein [Bacteroidales bacterium]
MINTAVKHIQPQDAFDKITKGDALLIDIREWEEIEIFAYDVEPQLVLPLSELSTRFHEIPRDQEVIIACNSGSRSHQLVQYLREQHYLNAVNLYGGIQEWLNLNLPVTWDNQIPDEKKKSA